MPAHVELDFNPRRHAPYIGEDIEIDGGAPVLVCDAPPGAEAGAGYELRTGSLSLHGDARREGGVVRLTEAGPVVRAAAGPGMLAHALLEPPRPSYPAQWSARGDTLLLQHGTPWPWPWPWP